MEQATTEILIVTTLATADQAARFSHELVKRRLAACVTRIPGAYSCYHWQGEIAEENEIVLLIKSDRSKLSDMEMAFAELHPYEVPEIIVFDIDKLSAPYQKWMRAELNLREGS